MSRLAITSPLPPEAFWQPEWFEREKSEIFGNNWIFVGFTDSLKEHNSYISTTVAGLPVIVRNMNGKVVAFRNICTHRHSIIHPQGCGIAAFRCPYHGWMFDAAGVPLGVPDNESGFGFSPEDKRSLALDPIAVDRCGRFVFVRLNPTGATLRQGLGPLVEVMEHVSPVFTQHYFQDVKRWDCNWKGATEITMEGYHGPYVHAGSFYHHVKVLDPAAQTEDTQVDYHIDYWNPHSAEYSPLSFETSKQLERIRARLKLPQSDRMRGYEHFFIYPNAMLAVYSGTNATVVRFDPLAPDETRMERWLLTGTPAEAKILEGLPWRTVMQEWQREGTTILEEDRIACEKTQLGVRHAREHGRLGKSEQRVGHYQSMIAQQMAQQQRVA